MSTVLQLHPGDLGWNWSFGAVQLAESVRVWRRDGEVLAVGLVDGVGLVRMGIAPSVDRDREFAVRLLADLPEIGVQVEARSGTIFREFLTAAGWLEDEPWTSLRRLLADEVDDCGLRVEIRRRAQRSGTGRRAAGRVRELVVHPRALAHDGGRIAVPAPGA